MRHRWECNGVYFGALAGAVATDRELRIPGKSWWPGERLTEEDVARLGQERLGVLVTHDSPMGAPPTFPGRRDPDTDAVRELIRRAVMTTRPRLVVHGHHHIRLSSHLSWIDTQASESAGEIVWADTRVEGFDMNQAERKGDAWGLLLLPSLHLDNGSIHER